jgi:signal transduction histidine kinase
MPRWGHGDRIRADEIPVRLHDVATGVAIGVSLLKGASQSEAAVGPTYPRALALFEDSLAQLRTLTAATAADSRRHRSPSRLVDSIEAEATRLQIRIDLDINGQEGWLAPDMANLVLLVIREGLRNISRHSGSSACKVEIDLASCPFSVRVRDWGSGRPAGGMTGSGIQLLQRMAADVGCELGVASQPGLGTDLVLNGPLCNCHRTPSVAEISVQAKLSSRADEQTATHANHTLGGGQKR